MKSGTWSRNKAANKYLIHRAPGDTALKRTGTLLRLLVRLIDSDVKPQNASIKPMASLCRPGLSGEDEVTEQCTGGTTGLQEGSTCRYIISNSYRC